MAERDVRFGRGGDEGTSVRTADDIPPGSRTIQVRTADSSSLSAEQPSGQEIVTTRLLLKAADTLTSSVNTQEVLTGLAKVALEFTGLTRAFVNLIDVCNRVLIPMVSTDQLVNPPGPVIGFDQLSQKMREAIASRATVIIDYEDSEASALDQSIAKANRARLVLFVPLQVDDEIVGHLSLDEPDYRHPFTQREIELVQSIASQASLVVRNARLFEGERKARNRANRELKTTRLLLRASEALAGLTETNHVFTTLVDVILSSVSHSRVVVETWDEQNARLEVVATGGRPIPADEVHTAWQALDDATRTTLEERTTRVSDFDALSAQQRRKCGRLDSHLALQVPIVYRERLLGLISVDDPDDRPDFTRSEIQLVEGIAAQAAVAMENSRLFAAEQQHARLANALAEIDERLHSSLDHNEIMRRAVAEGALALTADSGALALRSDGSFVIQYAYGFDRDLVGAVVPEEKERHSLLALEGKTPIFVEDAATDPRVDAEHMSSFGIGAVIVIPLVVAGEGIGTLYYNFRHPHRVSAAEREFARRVGNSLSLAVDNARLLERECTNARINAALTRIDRSIHATLQQDEMLCRVAIESADAIGADSFALALYEGGQWVVRYAYNLHDGAIGQRVKLEEAPFLVAAIEGQQPVTVEDAFNDTRAVERVQREIGVRAVMVAPLIVRDAIIGGLFFNYREVHRFSDHEIRYASRLASSVGLAIANIRMYEAERQIADKLQSALLTLPAKLPGVDFAHSYHSATEALRVGGDFYDIFQMNHQYIGITIGDISGKGLDAAAVTSLVKHSIRALAMERGKTPAQVLSLTNEVVFRSTPVESFATVFFGMLDCRDGRLVYANAGHSAAVVVPDVGELACLPPTGPILGAFKCAEFQQAVCNVDLDAMMFFYTDGLTEARIGGEHYGEERLYRLLESCRLATVQEVVEAATEDVLAYTNQRLHDDLAVLAVRRKHSKWAIPRQQRLPF